MKDKLKTIAKYIFTIALIVVSGYLSIKDIALEDIINALANANYLWVILSIPIILLAHWLRAMRWKTMLKPLIQKTSTYRLFKAVMIGYAANSVTPRGGELLRPYVYAREEGISFSSCFGTIVVERFLDLLTLLVVFLVALTVFRDKIIRALQDTFDAMGGSFDPSKVTFIVTIIALIFIFSFYPPVYSFILRITVKPFSNNLYTKIKGLFDRFRDGFAIIKDPSEYTKIAGYSIGIWICYGIPNYLMFYSFDFQAHHNLGIADAMLLLIVTGLAFLIAPTPGAIGVHHVVISKTMIILYGVTNKEALAYAILTHAINYIVNSITGGYYYLKKDKNIKLNEMKLGEVDPEKSTE